MIPLSYGFPEWVNFNPLKPDSPHRAGRHKSPTFEVTKHATSKRQRAAVARAHRAQATQRQTRQKRSSKQQRRMQ